jgi:hypothetical protein
MYYFASADQVNTFKLNPKRYPPEYDEYYPYSLALGRRAGIALTNLKFMTMKYYYFMIKARLMSSLKKIRS